MAGPKAEDLREHLEVLKAFERDYRAYVETQIAADHGATGPRPWESLPALRTDLLRRVTRAARALDASGVQIAITPPPMFGGPILASLASQIFAHETPRFGSGGDGFDAARMVLDALGTAIGSLEDQLEQQERRARERSAPSRAVHQATARVPTLWGHIRALPHWLATAADAITVGGFVAAAVTKIAGLW